MLYGVATLEGLPLLLWVGALLLAVVLRHASLWPDRLPRGWGAHAPRMAFASALLALGWGVTTVGLSQGFWEDEVPIGVTGVLVAGSLAHFVPAARRRAEPAFGVAHLAIDLCLLALRVVVPPWSPVFSVCF
ncbi:MAG: hypothetical protein H6732_05035 [Alphaproteobacteria bacterium]|nr:hypothetical protein [Alphaproteobacteria bacterium]